MGGKVWGVRSIIHRYKIDRGIKNNIGSGEAKEVILMVHGHELRVGGDAGGRQGAGRRGRKGRKKWDNCNSIINKIHLKISFLLYLISFASLSKPS